MNKCSSCNGQYVPVQTDGTLYFHACPPGTVNPRDENVPSTLASDAKNIKLAGKGASVVAVQDVGV
jgi:hypothetical protein